MSTVSVEFFEQSNLKVYKVKEVDTHGGSLRVYASKNKNKRTHKSVKEYIEIEKKHKLDEIDTYYKFAEDVENIKLQSLDKINGLLKEDKKIIGYGAPAKATTVLNYFGLTEKEFLFTIDDNFLKQDKYIPGTNIQIKNLSSVKTNSYDYVLVLAWNFFDVIKKNNKKTFENSEFIKLK